MWAAIILFGFGAFVTRGGAPSIWGPFLAGCVLCVVCVWDGGAGAYALDKGVRPGAPYRYAFFVAGSSGHWSRPVRQIITPPSPHAAASLEASHRPSPVLIPGAERRSTPGKTLLPDPAYHPRGADVG